MNILALDTATPSTAVAVQTADGHAIDLRDDPQPAARGEHAEQVLTLAAAALAEVELDWAAIDLVAVGTGPGGYTGLRIGIATARALGRACAARLAGVCTLRTLAEPRGGFVLALIDARRGELFAAAYKDDVELVAPCVIRPAQLAGLREEIDAAELCAVGDGAIAWREELALLGVEVPAEDAAHRVSAAAACRIAARAEDPDLTPLYLRRPDAELALER
jgi:tRNA threonylcarbamoyladenosine biosynthesis protein TsaB